MGGGDIVALEHGDKVPQLFSAERDVWKTCCFIESVFRDGHHYAVGRPPEAVELFLASEAH